MEYGLVLAGGGVRGAYQIGVWKALNTSRPPSCPGQFFESHGDP